MRCHRESTSIDTLLRRAAQSCKIILYHPVNYWQSLVSRGADRIHTFTVAPYRDRRCRQLCLHAGRKHKLGALVCLQAALAKHLISERFSRMTCSIECCLPRSCQNDDFHRRAATALFRATTYASAKADRSFAQLGHPFVARYNERPA